jgi:hypothetical protein
MLRNHDTRLFLAMDFQARSISCPFFYNKYNLLNYSIAFYLFSRLAPAIWSLRRYLTISSERWHEERHRLKPWWEYFLGILIKAYREFEERVGVVTKIRGAKTAVIGQAIERLPSAFSISDLERICPIVSRDMIRKIKNLTPQADSPTSEWVG